MLTDSANIVLALFLSLHGLCVHVNEVKARQRQATHLHPGQIFFERKKGAALSGIRTHDTPLYPSYNWVCV